MYNPRRLPTPSFRDIARRLPLLTRPRLSRRAPRLRNANRTLSDALDQLRVGIPLNWSQMEDHPELMVLAGLQDAARECREQYSNIAPAELKEALFEKLSARLPEWKPEPVKAPPRSLAGFSESVPVLTQVEEDVPPIKTNPLKLALLTGTGFVALLVAILAITGQFTQSKGFTWIAAYQDGQPVAKQHIPADWKSIDCATQVDSNLWFTTGGSTASANNMESNADFPVILLPSSVTTQITATQEQAIMQLGSRTPITSKSVPELVPITYHIALAQTAVHPCSGRQPQPNDPGATIRLDYSVIPNMPVGYYAGRPFGITVFEAKQKPSTIDVSSMSWKEVQAGEAHGIYATGSPYLDPQGTDWPDDSGVLIAEKGDVVITIISNKADEGLLVGLARGLR